MAQPGRAPGLGPGGRRFESCLPNITNESMYEKVIFAETYGFKDFITEDERVFLLESARKLSGSMNVVGSKRMFYLDNVSEFPHELIGEIRRRIVEVENLVNYKEPEKAKNFFAEYGKNSECRLHRDPTLETDYFHVRYNLMLSKPDRGGQTVHGDEFLDIDERVLWKCFAEHLEHGSDVVMGNKPRSIISMGFLIAK